MTTGRTSRSRCPSWSAAYEVSFGGRSCRLALAEGADRTVDLDPATALTIELVAGRPDGATVPVTMTLSGAGSHHLEARAFNALVTGLPAAVELTGPATRTEHLTVQIKDPSMPWLLAVVPDGRLGNRAETGGTAAPLRPIA